MCPAGRSRGAKHSPRETGIRVSAPFPGGGGTHPLGLEFKQSSLARAWPNSRTPLDPLTLGLTSLHPHAVVPSLLSDEGKRIVLPAFFQRGRDFPDKTRQTLATAHAPARHAEGTSAFGVARVGLMDRLHQGSQNRRRQHERSSRLCPQRAHTHRGGGRSHAPACASVSRRARSLCPAWRRRGSGRGAGPARHTTLVPMIGPATVHDLTAGTGFPRHGLPGS